jgi:NitT/TauT family transport system ATP-binding protein
MIEFKHVRKVFQNAGSKTGIQQGASHPVFEDLNAFIGQHEFVGILGPSGCGKSTLLKMIAGLASTDGGKIEYRHSPRIGFVFQEPNLLPWLTVQENATIPFQINNLKPDLNALDLWLHKLNLQNSRHQFPHQLSGGMKMRASFLRALMMKPELLLLDEPFAALDEVIRVELQRQLFELSKEQKLTVLFVTHSVSEATKLCNRILLLDYGGKIVLDERQDQEKFQYQFSQSQQNLSSRILENFPQLREPFQRGVR